MVVATAEETTMKALVVYESMFGNTRCVANAVADELRRHMTVEVYDVEQAPAAIHELIDLIVVGGPTHAFSLSRPKTRADAAQQGASVGSPATGIREWLEHLPSGPHSESVATFDTRAEKARHLPGSAAKKADRIARAHGYGAAIARESFYVSDVSGPLLPGELERAGDWGRDLAQRVTDLAHGVSRAR
jgi:hypothetical protein